MAATTRTTRANRISCPASTTSTSSAYMKRINNTATALSTTTTATSVITTYAS